MTLYGKKQDVSFHKAFFCYFCTSCKGEVTMDNYRNQEPFAKNGLYDPRFEHENCGIGAVVNMDGTSDRKVVDSALRIVETLEHRAGKDAEGKTGDGVGILLQISHTIFRKWQKKPESRSAANGNTVSPCSSSRRPGKIRKGNADF